MVKKRAQINEPNKIGSTPFYIAASNGYVDILEFLYKNGADVDKRQIDGWSALHIAAREENLNVLEYLLEKEGLKADVRNDDCLTPFHIGE